MTPEAFARWAAAMRDQNPDLYGSDRDLAAALGVHYNAMLRYRQRGAKRPVALACRALLNDMEPFS